MNDFFLMDYKRANRQTVKILSLSGTLFGSTGVAVSLLLAYLESVISGSGRINFYVIKRLFCCEGIVTGGWYISLILLFACGSIFIGIFIYEKTERQH